MTASAPVCELCRHFFALEDCAPGSVNSVGIGLVCSECAPHTLAAFEELSMVPGIASRCLADHERQAPRPRRRRKEAQ